MDQKQPKKIPEMARIADVAVLLGITEKAATRRVREGDFKGAVKIGKSWFIPRPVLSAIAEGRKP